MIKQIINFLRNYARGEEATLDIEKEFHFTWWEVVAILIIIGLIIRWIWM